MRPANTHVIAEAGANHNGSLDEALRLIDLASRAGADSVKFQIIDPDELYLPGDYEYGHYDIREVVAMRRRFMLPDDAYRQLADRARELGLDFSASVFDRRGLELLCSLQPAYVKVASTDLNNVRFLRQVAEKGVRMILSTGMSSLAEIEFSVREILRTGFHDLVLMHCVSVYPARLEETNLSFIDVLASRFGFPVGFSDHTEGAIAAAIAIAKGATYIEKHVTRDRAQEGFDHHHAMDEAGMTTYVSDLRAAQAAIREAADKVGEAERATRKRARRALYAAREMQAGETIRDEDILILRPENAMSASQCDDLVGKVLTKGIARHEAFTVGHIGFQPRD